MPSECNATVDRRKLSSGYCSEIFFPLGFPVRIVTNRAEVLEMARRSWSKFTPMSSSEPLVIELKFGEGELKSLIKAPSVQIDGELLTVAFDEKSVVVADLGQGVARGMLAEMFLKMELHLRYYVLEAIALSMISTLRAVALHGASIAWNGTGVLLCGESGAGKTTLAYACARSGWSYVSDDASYLLLEGEHARVVGNCHQIRFRDASAGLFTELSGRENTPRVAGKPSIEVGTNELPGIRQADFTDIRFILFLNRSGELAPGLHAIARDQVKNYFKKFLLVPAPHGSPTDEALERLLGAQMFEMRYTDLDSAVQLLSETIEGSKCRIR